MLWASNSFGTDKKLCKLISQSTESCKTYCRFCHPDYSEIHFKSEACRHLSCKTIPSISLTSVTEESTFSFRTTTFLSLSDMKCLVSTRKFCSGERPYSTSLTSFTFSYIFFQEPTSAASLYLPPLRSNWHLAPRQGQKPSILRLTSFWWQVRNMHASSVANIQEYWSINTFLAFLKGFSTFLFRSTLVFCFCSTCPHLSLPLFKSRIFYRTVTRSYVIHLWIIVISPYRWLFSWLIFATYLSFPNWH